MYNIYIHILKKIVRTWQKIVHMKTRIQNCIIHSIQKLFRLTAKQFFCSAKSCPKPK